MNSTKTFKIIEKYSIIISTFELTDSQMRRLDQRLEQFAKENKDIIDRISLNKRLEGVL